MKMSDEVVINASVERVWEALNDVDVLAEAIPGCETLERLEDGRLAATVKQKIGPVSAKFAGEVELKDLNPPHSYRIEGEGKGGAAGFAKGGADVRLSEGEDGGTLLAYDVDATVGGKIAQLGGRLIDATAKKLAGKFFDKFKQVVEQG